MLYITFPWLIYFMALSLYFLTPFTHFENRDKEQEFKESYREPH